MQLVIKAVFCRRDRERRHLDLSEHAASAKVAPYTPVRPTAESAASTAVLCDAGAGIGAGEASIWVLADASAPMPAPLLTCPVCLDPMRSDAITLSCSHVLCSPCATKCSGAGHARCPVCRHPHLLDPAVLRERRAKWRSAYSDWRQGKARGAAGELSSIAQPAKMLSALDLAGAPRAGLAKKPAAT